MKCDCGHPECRREIVVGNYYWGTLKVINHFSCPRVQEQVRKGAKIMDKYIKHRKKKTNI